VLWGGDISHGEGAWPTEGEGLSGLPLNRAECLRELLAGLPAAQTHSVLYEVFQKAFVNLDMPYLSGVTERVGLTREELRLT
jgi:hypothetical protein